MKKINTYTLLVLSAITLTLFAFKNRLLNNEEIIPCQEIIIMCAQGVHGGNYVINNQTDYEALLTVRSPHPDCGRYQLPPIDFNQYTLLGVVGGVGGCKSPILEHSVIKNQNTYIFNYTVTQRGMCKIGFSFKIWCLIPKIGNSSTVEFNLIEHFEPSDEAEKKLLEDYNKENKEYLDEKRKQYPKKND